MSRPCLPLVSRLSPACLPLVSRVSPCVSLCALLPQFSIYRDPVPPCLRVSYLSPTCLPLVSHLSPTCLPLVSHLSPTCLPLVSHLPLLCLPFMHCFCNLIQTTSGVICFGHKWRVFCFGLLASRYLQSWRQTVFEWDQRREISSEGSSFCHLSIFVAEDK